MQIIVARWPNNSFSVLKPPKAWDEFWLFDALDEIGSPLDAQITVVRGEGAAVDFPTHEKSKTDRPTVYGGAAEEWRFGKGIAARFYAKHVDAIDSQRG